MLTEQLELFPRASKKQIKKARKLLGEYEKCMRKIEVYEAGGLEKLDPDELDTYIKCKHKTSRINRAVRLILDPEIREIISFRFLEGNTYSLTAHKYSGMNMMDVRTVSRKIQKGIESVANELSGENVSSVPVTCQ